MGNYTAAKLLGLFLILGLTVPCLATTYVVPWRTSLNLTIFPLGKTFYVGDVLDFLYTPYTNAVFLVDSIGFAACTPARGVALGIMGNTSYTLPTTGYFYFISFFNDCLLGQKLVIRVSVRTPPTPTPSPILPPSPSPCKE